MVCFCNTPLSRAENHARVYGKYYIALDKEFILDIYNPILNPVIYYSSENLARSIFCLDNTKIFCNACSYNLFKLMQIIIMIRQNN